MQSATTGAPLRIYFDSLFAPAFLCGASPRTWLEYRATLSTWERLTHNPPLGSVSPFDLASFKAAAVAAGLAVATVNKHLRHLSHLLTKAGPIGPGNRDGLGLVAVSPWTKPLREREKQIRTVDDAAFMAFYESTGAARYPNVPGILPAAWWRALIVCALTLIVRRQALLGLTWGNVDLVGKWVTVEGTTDKAGRVRRKRLHDAARSHLLRIRHPGPLVFPFPHSEKTFYRSWARIEAAAGVSFGLHDLKRTALSRLAGSCDAFTLQRLGDHSSVRTTQRYYVNVDDAGLAAAVDGFQLPGELGKDSDAWKRNYEA